MQATKRVLKKFLGTLNIGRTAIRQKWSLGVVHSHGTVTWNGEPGICSSPHLTTNT